MRKAYQKPTVYAESFELVEHIAGLCSVSGLANHQDYLSCGFYNEGETGQTIFLNDTANCDYCPFETDAEAILEYESGVYNECHYSFDDNYALFSS